MERNKVILVDKNDIELGAADKLDAHKTGQLHRAFSVLVFNTMGQLLIHKRADGKYHSGGLWTNTCCSHPQPGEDVIDSAERRLFEEMGIKCSLTFKYKFIYKANLNNGLIENELDYVFTGTSNGIPHPDSSEIQDWAYIDFEELIEDVELNSNKYTYWFKEILKVLNEERAAAQYAS